MRQSLTLLLAACLAALSSSAPAQPVDSTPPFFRNLGNLCDARFEGYMNYPDDPDHSFAGQLLVAEVAVCNEREIRIPFAVGDDRSRTWIVSVDDGRLRLQHDHRMEDGTSDEINLYGGWSSDLRDENVQSFAADEHTRQLIPEAATNVWTLTLGREELTYALERHGKPRFRATLRRISKPGG